MPISIYCFNILERLAVSFVEFLELGRVLPSQNKVVIPFIKIRSYGEFGAWEACKWVEPKSKSNHTGGP